LKDIPGDSTSERLRNAVKFADPNEGMRSRAIERRLDMLCELVQRVYAQTLTGEGLGVIEMWLDAEEWLWR
jgi:hypothetical protein